ncbi:hypothetical protein DAEQUDRAFT_355275 [Daedalea quercina L-15889]|uniref:Helicase ATP-binding domain-containing protein n=1 Tax=Daedalea quercina L-15889 TaxID=1314783 RepID=A0A165TQV0_9APHY|nr:hypothetical protein DAEQUDRAFT_355275 [Daedalea quercina L-15889]
MASSAKDAQDVSLEVLLKQLRDVPVVAPSDKVLTRLTNHLIGSPNQSTLGNALQPHEHWFCSHAMDTTREVATFLIRLHAYDSDRVKAWRRQLRRCLTGCCACVRGFQEVKVTSRETYFGAFTDSVLGIFFDNLDNWELETVLSGLAEVGMTADSVGVDSHSLAVAPPAVTYHIFYNPHVIRDARISKIVRSSIPKDPITLWPADFPPPCLFYLVVDEREDVRKWALGQLGLCKAAAMSAEWFLPSYCTVIKSVTSVVSDQANDHDAVGTDSSFSRDPTVLWSGYSVTLRYVPVAFLRPRKALDIDIRHVVTSHLHDTGSNFMDVLKAFLLILSRIGPGIWESEGPEYPQVVFSSIKDNVRYLEILQNLEDTRKENWLLNWVEAYLKSLGNLPVCKDVLPLVVHFYCEELQHQRFPGVRPAAICIAGRILLAVLTQVEKGHPVLQQSLVWEIMDVHSSIFVTISFAKAYTGDAWMEARSLARKLIKFSLVHDMKTVSSAISCLCGTTSSSTVPTSVVLRDQLWKGMFINIQPGDSDAMAMMLTILSNTSHIDDLKEAAFADRIARSKDADALRSLLGSVNRALGTMRSGFGDAMARYIDHNHPSVVADLLHRPDVVQNVTVLMLSPIEMIQENTQAFAGAAYDVEVRSDCFRALLEKVPDATFSGILQFLETFVHYAPEVPEACSLSKALARCLTDIIDVLCSSPDGLLLDHGFLTEAVGANVPARLPKWWNMMTQALSVIFSKTPRWAVYFENAEMVLWMRDALIFGRDMLAQRRVIESATLVQSQQAGVERRMSRVGKKMVDDLQVVLLELTRWLRLTDEELLHQSFALLETLLSCFRETAAVPKPEALQKLQKHIDDARKTDSKRPQTRLDAPRLARLQDAISSFDEDDEVEIISYKPPEKRKEPSDSKTTVVEANRKEAKTSLPVKDKGKVVLRASDRQFRKPSISSYFSAEDRKKLDAAPTVVPQLSRRLASQVVPAIKKDLGAQVPTKGPLVRLTTSEPTTDADSEESDDEDGAGLASLSKLQRTPVIKKPVERRQVMMMDLPTKARNPALERLNKREDARRTQLRLKPDVSSLHRTLLSWDYDHDGPSPPGQSSKLERVPPTFSDAEHFRRVFEPMFLLECWTQLVESKEGVLKTYDIRIASRQFVDDWLDLDVTFSGSVDKDWSLGDTDVVLLRQPKGKKGVLAKVQNYKGSPFGIQATIRCCARGSDPGLQPNSMWSLGKALSLTTLYREYGALMSLPYYDLSETILRAKLNKPTIPDSKEVQRTMATYNVNEPQAKAILYSLTADGFALIQGPPGTGKTSTICGLVHAFLSRRPKPGTQIYVSRNAGPADKEPVKKILLCAPSNAAIDEIAFRLKEGVSGAGRQSSSPKVVRLGNVKAMNASVKDVSLEYLIEQKLNANPQVTNPSNAGGEITRLRAELENLKKTRQQKFDEISQIHDNTSKTFALEEDIKKLNKEKNALTHQIDKLRDQQKSDSRTMDATRRRFRTEVLQEADVVCSTLSGSAYEYLEQFDFELIVIDEAAQAIELSSLIPLKYNCKHCVMVGDPQQLPPTVKSQEACSFGYDQSLFVRLQRQRPDAVHLLSIQYRMHPDISQVPSRLFYNGRLQDGPDMAVKTRRPWHAHEKFGTYRFFNVPEGHEETGMAHSYINRGEVKIAVALFNRLRREFTSFDFDSKIGVISMYRGQILAIRRAFEEKFGPEITSIVDFNTVDGFQGQEKDIVILSCVRAGPGVQSVGFLRDVRRMNVALTRAKSSIFVLGHAPTLERSDDIWRSIVMDARERNRLTNVDVAFFTTPITVKKPQSSTKAPKTQSKIRPPEVINAMIPDTLLTPRELKSGAKGGIPTVSSPGSAPSSSNMTKPSEKPTLKRLAPTEEGGDDTKAVSTGPSNGAQAPSRPPPKKRPKTAPTLFIPKNKRAPQ